MFFHFTIYMKLKGTTFRLHKSVLYLRVCPLTSARSWSILSCFRWTVSVLSRRRLARSASDWASSRAFSLPSSCTLRVCTSPSRTWFLVCRRCSWFSRFFISKWRASVLSTSGNSCSLQLHLSVISIDNIYINKNGKIFLNVKYIKDYLEPIHLIVHSHIFLSSYSIQCAKKV